MKKRNSDKMCEDDVSKIEYNRVFRGSDAESWYMFHTKLKDKQLDTSLRIGFFHLFFEKEKAGKTFTEGTLVLEQDWGRKALSKLVKDLERFVTDPAEIRGDFMIDVHFAKAGKNIMFCDSIDSKGEEKESGVKD